MGRRSGTRVCPALPPTCTSEYEATSCPSESTFASSTSSTPRVVYPSSTESTRTKRQGRLTALPASPPHLSESPLSPASATLSRPRRLEKNSSLPSLTNSSFKCALLRFARQSFVQHLSLDYARFQFVFVTFCSLEG